MRLNYFGSPGSIAQIPANMAPQSIHAPFSHLIAPGLTRLQSIPQLT